MSTLHNAPDTMQAKRQEFETVVERWLVKQGAEPEERSHICKALKPIFLKHAEPSPHFTGSPEKALADLNAWVHDKLNSLMMVVMMRELELFQLRGIDDATENLTVSADIYSDLMAKMQGKSK